MMTIFVNSSEKLVTILKYLLDIQSTMLKYEEKQGETKSMNLISFKKCNMCIHIQS